MAGKIRQPSPVGRNSNWALSTLNLFVEKEKKEKERKKERKKRDQENKPLQEVEKAPGI